MGGSDHSTVIFGWIPWLRLLKIMPKGSDSVLSSNVNVTWDRCHARNEETFYLKPESSWSKEIIIWWTSAQSSSSCSCLTLVALLGTVLKVHAKWPREIFRFLTIAFSFLSWTLQTNFIYSCGPSPIAYSTFKENHTVLICSFPLLKPVIVYYTFSNLLCYSTYNRKWQQIP